MPDPIPTNRSVNRERARNAEPAAPERPVAPEPGPPPRRAPGDAQPAAPRPPRPVPPRPAPPQPNPPPRPRPAPRPARPHVAPRRPAPEAGQPAAPHNPRPAPDRPAPPRPGAGAGGMGAPPGDIGARPRPRAPAARTAIPVWWFGLAAVLLVLGLVVWGISAGIQAAVHTLSGATQPSVTATGPSVPPASAAHSPAPATSMSQRVVPPPAPASSSRPAPTRTTPTQTQSGKVWTSPTSFPITYPADMATACIQQYGQGASAQLTSTSVPSYDVVCVQGGTSVGGLDLDSFCAWLAQQDHYRSADGWWSGNPKRFDTNASDQPWLDWRCYNSENRP
jgi:hypothetical protein